MPKRATGDNIAADLDELNRHLGRDALDRSDLRASLTADGAVFETGDGATFLLHHDHAWKLDPVRNVLTCWHAGRRLGTARLGSNWRDVA